MVSLMRLMGELNDRTVCVFQLHCETKLFKIKFHLFCFLYEELDAFGSVRLLLYQGFTIMRSS